MADIGASILIIAFSMFALFIGLEMMYWLVKLVLWVMDKLGIDSSKFQEWLGLCTEGEDNEVYNLERE